MLLTGRVGAVTGWLINLRTFATTRCRARLRYAARSRWIVFEFFFGMAPLYVQGSSSRTHGSR